MAKKTRSMNADHATQLRIRESFDYLKTNEPHLTEGQKKLLKGLQLHYRKHRDLSEKQRKILFELRQFLNPRNEYIIKQRY